MATDEPLKPSAIFWRTFWRTLKDLREYIGPMIAAIASASIWYLFGDASNDNHDVIAVLIGAVTYLVGYIDGRISR